MDREILFLIVLMFILIIFFAINFINDIKLNPKIEKINEFITENNLTENSCHVYCYLTRC